MYQARYGFPVTGLLDEATRRELLPGVSELQTTVATSGRICQMRPPAPPLPFVCWLGSSMSPFYTEGDLAGTPVSFSPSVRNMCCSQVGRDVLRQETAVLKYTSRGIRTECISAAVLRDGA